MVSFSANPVMVIVDTLEKFRPIQNGKTNAYSTDYAAVTGLQGIASRYRIAVVINHGAAAAPSFRI